MVDCNDETIKDHSDESKASTPTLETHRQAGSSAVATNGAASAPTTTRDNNTQGSSDLSDAPSENSFIDKARDQNEAAFEYHSNEENLAPTKGSEITARVTRSQTRNAMAGKTFQQGSIKSGASTSAAALKKGRKQAAASKKPVATGQKSTRTRKGDSNSAAGAGDDRNDVDESGDCSHRQPPSSKNGLMDHPSDSDENENIDNERRKIGRRKPPPSKDRPFDALFEDEHEDEGDTMVVNSGNGNDDMLAALDDIDNEFALVPHRSVEDNRQNHSVANQTRAVAPPPASAGAFDGSELYARILDLDKQGREMSTQLADNMKLLKRQQTNLEKHGDRIEKHGDRIDRHENHLIEARKDIETHNENVAKQLDLNKAKVDMMNNFINLKLEGARGKRGRDVDSEDEGYDPAPRKKHLNQAQASHLTTPQRQIRAAKQAYGSSQRRAISPQPTRHKSLKAVTDPDYDEDSDTSGSGVDVTIPLAREKAKAAAKATKKLAPRTLRPPPRQPPTSFATDCGGVASGARHDPQAEAATWVEIAAARRAEGFNAGVEDPYAKLTPAPGVIRSTPGSRSGSAEQSYPAPRGPLPYSAQDPTISTPSSGGSRSFMPQPSPPLNSSSAQTPASHAAQPGHKSGRRKKTTMPKNLFG